MQDNNDEDVAVRKRRALYRASHRGTREMDFLLGHFAAAAIEGFTADELTTFETLLTLPDPALMAAIIDGVGSFEAPINALIERIGKYHRDKS